MLQTVEKGKDALNTVGQCLRALTDSLPLHASRNEPDVLVKSMMAKTVLPFTVSSKVFPKTCWTEARLQQIHIGFQKTLSLKYETLKSSSWNHRVFLSSARWEPASDMIKFN